MNKRKMKAEPMCITSEKAERIIDSQEIERIKTAVGRRVVEACGYRTDAEIAVLLKTTRAEVETFTEGDEFPAAEMLLSVYRATGVSIHWLLTGEGSKRADYQVVFAVQDDPAVFGLA